MTAVTGVPAAPDTGPSRPSPRPRRGRIALPLALVWIALLAVLAATAGLVAPFDPTAPAGPARLPPFSDPSHLLGVDSLGRDVLSRLLHGIRISAAVGVGATLIAVAAGVLIGLLAAYYRGWVEAVVNVLNDTVLSFPPLLVLLALAAVVNPGGRTRI